LIVISVLLTSFPINSLYCQIIWQPHIGEGKILGAYWASTGTDFSEIVDSDKVVLRIRNDINISASLAISARASIGLISPPSNSPPFDEYETKTLNFTLSNLGVYEAKTGNVTFTVKDTWGNLDDQVTLSFKLFVGMITVRVLDKETAKELSGMSVTCESENFTESKLTTNGEANFKIEKNEKMEINVYGMGEYKSKSITTYPELSEKKVVTLYLEKAQSGDIIGIPWSFLLVVIITCAVLLLGVAIYLTRFRKMRPPSDIHAD